MNSIAIQQVRDINELNMWQVQRTIDNLTTQYHDGQPIQLCASCDKRKDRQLTRENKFQQDVLVGGKNATVREETRFRKTNHHICLFAQIGYRHNPTGQLHQPKILQFHRKTNVSKKKKKHTKKEV